MDSGHLSPLLVLLLLLVAGCEEKTSPGRAPRSSGGSASSKRVATEPARAPSASNQAVAAQTRTLKPPDAGALPLGVSTIKLTSSAPSPNGDGCSQDRVYFAHGWFTGRPVRATLRFRARRLKLKLLDIATQGTTEYSGDLDRSVCGKRVSLDELTGLLVATGRAQPTRMRTVFSENRLEPDDLGQLRIDGRDVAPGRDLMQLYEVPAERFDAIAEYEQILGAPADIRAGLRVAVDHTVVAHFDFESEGHGDPDSSPRRALILSQLRAKRGGAAHTVRTSLGCYFHDCRVAMLGYQILDEAVLIVPVVSQQYCGARSCGERSNGAIWMLTPQGFRVVEASIEADRSPSLPGYPESENDVIVHWVDADGMPPMDLLVRSQSGVQGDSTDLSLFVFNSTSHLNERANAVPQVNPSEIRELPELLRVTPDGP